MDDAINWLVTILCDGTLIRCALKVDKWDLPEGRVYDITRHPMEPENREAIHALLPMHVRSCGPVVDVVELFDVHVRDSAVRLRERDLANAEGQHHE